MSQRTILADCTDCGKTFKGCVCKNCSKCTNLFKCYMGTSLPKTRSHCRYCGAAICPSCLLSGMHPLKSCNPCHVAFMRKVQKGQDALISLAVESSGLQGEEGASNDGVPGITVSPTMNFNDMSNGEQHIWLVEAVKKGNHPLISMLLDSGADVNLVDTSGNPILFCALRYGHLACVALMMERGVDIHVVNAEGWTVLHVVGRYGTTEQHAECCEMLVQMGADVFARNAKGRTALDLALRHSANSSIVSSLRHSQMSQSLDQLQSIIRLPANTSVKASDLHRSVACVVDYVSLPEEDRSVASASSSFSFPPQRIAEDATVLAEDEASSTDVVKNSLTASDTPVQARGASSQGSAPTSNQPSPPDTPSARPASPAPDKSLELIARVRELEAEKRAANAKCLDLVETIAKTAQNAAQRTQQMKEEIEALKRDHEEAIQRIEALNTNRVTKLRADCDAAVFEAAQRCQEAEQKFRDLNVLQQGLKLTWVADEFVKQCMNAKCRATFSQVVRRHHCRSCGRVYCKPCLANCVSLPSLGYEDAVKVCSSCYALVEDNFSPPS